MHRESSSEMRRLLFGLVLLTPAAATAQDTTVVQGATVIDGTGRDPIANASLVIAGGRIVAIGATAATRVPAKARIIPAHGKFVIPGLMDANVHLVYGISIEFLARYEGRFEDLVAEAAQVSLANGLTTIFDSWGPLGPLVRTRDRIASGEIPGSRLYVAGNIIGLTGPFGRDFNGDAEKTVSKVFVQRIDNTWEEGTGPELMWLTPDSLRSAIRGYTAKKMDFLKYAVSGHTSMEMLMFSPEQQRVIVEEGRRAGITVQTHTTSVESLRQALEAGVDLMQHCSITGRVAIPDATFELLRSGKVFCAVQSITKARLDVMTTAVAAGLPKRVFFGELIKVQDQNERRMIAAHIPVLLATDAGIMNPDEHDALPDNMKKDESTDLGRAHFLWFKAVTEKGMKPMDAIMAATSNIARAYHLDREIGTLEPGKRADLLILDADPLADIMNVEKITTVMKDGLVVDRAALPLKRVLTRP
jgi:imidazolonepropionase-like amidohydrolase